MSGIPSWARPGVKVVCIGRELRPWEPAIINDHGYRWKPERGSIYEIRGTTENEWGWFLFLVEEPRNHSFHGDAFRPLTEVSETDETEAKLYHKKHLHARRSERERA